jgi:hypothetical protein
MCWCFLSRRGLAHDHLRMEQFFLSFISRAQNDGQVAPSLDFPRSRAVLWDRTPRGEVVTIGPYDHVPVVCVPSVALSLLHGALQDGEPNMPSWLIARPNRITPDTHRLVCDSSQALVVDRWDAGTVSEYRGPRPTVTLPGEVTVQVLAADRTVRLDEAPGLRPADYSVHLDELRHDCSAAAWHAQMWSMM